MIKVSNDLTTLIPNHSNNYIEFGKSLKYYISEDDNVNAEIVVNYYVDSKSMKMKYIFKTTIKYIIILYLIIRKFINGERNSFKLIQSGIEK